MVGQAARKSDQIRAAIALVKTFMSKNQMVRMSCNLQNTVSAPYFCETAVGPATGGDRNYYHPYDNRTRVFPGPYYRHDVPCQHERQLPDSE